MVDLLEVVGRKEHLVAEVVPQPAHVGDDAVDVLFLFLDGVGVVKAQVELAAEVTRDPGIDRQCLGVADVQVAVGLRGEARVHSAVEATRSDVLDHGRADEVSGERVQLVVTEWGGVVEVVCLVGHTL